MGKLINRGTRMAALANDVLDRIASLRASIRRDGDWDFIQERVITMVGVAETRAAADSAIIDVDKGTIVRLQARVGDYSRRCTKNDEELLAIREAMKIGPESELEGGALAMHVRRTRSHNREIREERRRLKDEAKAASARESELQGENAKLKDANQELEKEVRLHAALSLDALAPDEAQTLAAKDERIDELKAENERLALENEESARVLINTRNLASEKLKKQRERIAELTHEIANQDDHLQRLDPMTHGGENVE